MSLKENLFNPKTLLVLLAVVVIALLGRWAFGGSCHGGVVDVSKRGQLTGLHAEGGRVIMFIKNQDSTGMQVITVDGCTGKEASDLTVKTR